MTRDVRMAAGLGRWCALVALIFLGVPLIVVQRPTVAAAATPTTATLTVVQGGDRDSPDTVNDLAGAVFDFYAGVSGTRPGTGAAPVASCTTGVLGICSVDVPGRFLANEGYWIVERTAPSGWALIETMDTGGDSTTPTVYNGVFTGAVFNDRSYTFPQVSSGNTNRTARGSQWADRRNNPPYPTTCGLNIALLIDLSGSISASLPQVKAAANGFVDALTGTPSTIALYSFSSNARTILDPTSVSEVSGAAKAQAAINSLAAGGATNWDAGLFAVASAPSPFDAVIMLTDGNPTVYGPPPGLGPGNFTRFTEVEHGVFSANAVKAEGTKVVAVGVGAGVTGSAENLQAISGPVRGEDFVQTDYAQLAAVFRALALKTCAGTISVVKKIIPPGGTPADAVPASGWTISTSTVDVTPASGETQDGTGAINFDANLEGAPSRSVTLAETLQSGYTLVQQGGANAACTADGTSIPVTDSGALGFTVEATATTVVSCVILNQAPDPLASVLVTKSWVINGDTFDDPSQPVQFQSTLALTDQDDASWGVTYEGYTAGQTVTVGETINQELLPPNCVNVASGDGPGSHTLAAGLNTFAVINTVTCTTILELVKAVQNPYGEPEPPTSWTLSAFAEGSPTPAFSGVTGVRSEVTPDAIYSMAETSVPGYTQDIDEGATIAPLATGSWSCANTLPDPAPGRISRTVFDGTSGQVAVGIGQTAQCTATNTAQAAAITLRKTVDNQFGGTATSRDWMLRAAPQVSDNEPSPIGGRDGDPGVTGAVAFPGVGYALSEESGPSGYLENAQVRCVLTGTDTELPTPGAVLTPDLGQEITCTFSNTDIGPRLTLLKEVTGGPAPATDWILQAFPAPGSGRPDITGRSGAAAVTNAPAWSNVGYALTESAGPRGYVEESGPTCALTGTTAAVPVTDAVVTLRPGQSVTCTFHNRFVPPLPATGTPLIGLIETGGASVLLGTGLLLGTWLIRRRSVIA